MLNQFPPLTIAVITYRRPTELLKTLTALSEHISYQGDINILVCDDSSGSEYAGAYWNTVTALDGLFLFRPGKVQRAFITTPHNMGWGGAVNFLLNHTYTEYILFLEDDYVLTEFIDLDRLVALFLTRPNIGMIRLRGTAGEHVVYHQFESDISAHCPDYREGMGLPGKLTYLQLDSGSHALYLYSNGPHLKHHRFHAVYGLYPEGKRLGETEEAYAHQVKDRMKQPNAPAIAIVPDMIPMVWDHIGVSFQHSEADKGGG